jgi:glycosyltransferase involved in cell wall biosynthesis
MVRQRAMNIVKRTGGKDGTNEGLRSEMKVLEITPYEPPASGWVARVKVVRRLITDRGGVCEVLDIGPSRKLQRAGCMPVQNGVDYLWKLTRFAARGFTFHGHVNGEYFRGLLLALAACSIARAFANRCLVTFHAGVEQPFFHGWKSTLIRPLFHLIFGLSHAVICNSATVKSVLLRYCRADKLHAIPAFSVQYLACEPVPLAPALCHFATSRSPLLSTYLCFRDGFFLEILVPALAQLTRSWCNLGLVIVGTGQRRAAFMKEVEDAGLQHHVFLAGDLDHETLMSLIRKSDVHLRTPTTDGVSATVLQALSLRVPVVASENGTRPASVVRYRADDPTDLATQVEWVLEHRQSVADAIELPPCGTPRQRKWSCCWDCTTCEPAAAR